MGELSRLGHRLREFRRRAKFTQHELSRRSGVSRTTIASIEIGQRNNITLDHALRLAHSLGVTVEALSGWDPLEQEDVDSETTGVARTRRRQKAK